MSETSSWLVHDDTASLEPRPAPGPRRAALPPGTVRAVPVGGTAEPALEPFPPAPPTPPPLTEAEVRGQLVELQQAARDAETASEAAQQAFRRAQEHAAGCADELAQFASLDDELKQLHVAALRSTEGDRPQITVPPELRQRISEHEQARLALDAASGAIPVFEREATVARGVATDARIALSNVADQLVARHALTMLAKRNEVAAELEKLDASVLSYEQFAKPAPRRISDFAMELYASGRRVALLDTGLWRALHGRLTADASAELTLSPTVTAVSKAA